MTTAGRHMLVCHGAQQGEAGPFNVILHRWLEFKSALMYCPGQGPGRDQGAACEAFRGVLANDN